MESLERLERRAPTRRKQRDWLIRHGRNVTSQGGEDGVLAEVFRVLDAAAPTVQTRRWCVEFGAWDGKHLSNTWSLLFQTPERWSGVLIEADAARVEAMRAMYREHANVTCVHSFITLDGDSRLDEVLARECPAMPAELDLMSIDVDGADYHVWAELERYEPKVVVIEFNPTIPNNVIFVQPRSTQVFQGSSLAALIELGKRKGYELVSTTTFNAVFVQARYFPLFDMEDNDIDVMHDVPMPTEFFQLYDGTIKITGCKKLIWKNIPINERDLQVIPESERGFPFQPSDQTGEQPTNLSSDVVGAASAHLNQCIQDGKEDSEYFLAAAKQAVGKTGGEGIRRILSMAVEVCHSPDSRVRASEAVWVLCNEFTHQELAENRPRDAVEWLREQLRVRPRCEPSDRAAVLATIGECLIRDRHFDEAEFHLQTAVAITPDLKPALKSLAKLYSKTGQTNLKDDVLTRLRAL